MKDQATASDRAEQGEDDPEIQEWQDRYARKDNSKEKRMPRRETGHGQVNKGKFETK